MKKLALIALFAALLVVPAASASTTKLLVTPSPAHVGDAVVFSGCGYPPSLDIQVQAVNNTKTAEYILQITETTDASGCFSTDNAPYVIPAAGKWVTNVFGVATGHKLATLNFTVT